ncbi:MAG: 30S ribosomal protein S4e [Candidatus Hodarchaeota archaeon]
MGKKGGSKHLKRFPAPKYWPIHRKTAIYTVKASPGPHSLENCIPLLILVREVFNLGETAKECKTIISEGNIKVDGKIRKNYKFPIGLMDVVEIPLINKIYRILPVRKKGLIPFPITKEEKDFKLCEIKNKNLINNGQIQLNLHDGRNIIASNSDAKYKTRDVLKISIPEQEILEHLPMKEGVSILVTAGKHIGAYGILKRIEQRFGPHASIVALEHEGETFQTALEYAFVIEDNIVKILS